ncbi:metal-dependent hydrolase, partial [Candidatus Saccharibacteria bacterium]|nr:metal-dependent hydrolase [Candidatus Saccharibacteria bacterium]
MTARTHDLAAITGLVVVLINQPVRTVSVATAILVVIANQLGGIAPDIDQPTAPFWRNLPIGGYIGRFIDKMLGGHRFITHSLLGLALTGFLLDMLLNILSPIMPSVDTGYVWWAFMIGMVSHLILDTFTKEGVPWLLPIPIKFCLPPVKSMRITTGKNAEKLLFFGLLAFNVWYISSHYTKMVDIPSL